MRLDFLCREERRERKDIKKAPPNYFEGALGGGPTWA